MKELVGQTITGVQTSTDDSYMEFITKDGGSISYKAVGDCCSDAYFYQCEGMESLVGQYILEVDESEVKAVRPPVRTQYDEDGEPVRPSTDDPHDTDEALDATFYTIHTDKGIATVEFRLSHNGYYGGKAEVTYPGPWIRTKYQWRKIA